MGRYGNVLGSRGHWNDRIGWYKYKYGEASLEDLIWGNTFGTNEGYTPQEAIDLANKSTNNNYGLWDILRRDRNVSPIMKQERYVQAWRKYERGGRYSVYWDVPLTLVPSPGMIEYLPEAAEKMNRCLSQDQRAIYIYLFPDVWCQNVEDIDILDTHVPLSIRVAKSLALKIQVPPVTLRSRIDNVLNPYDIINALKKDKSLIEDPYVRLVIKMIYLHMYSNNDENASVYYKMSMTGADQLPDRNVPYGLVLLLAYTIMKHTNPDTSWYIYTLENSYQYKPILYNRFTAIGTIESTDIIIPYPFGEEGARNKGEESYLFLLDPEEEYDPNYIHTLLDEDEFKRITTPSSRFVEMSSDVQMKPLFDDEEYFQQQVIHAVMVYKIHMGIQYILEKYPI